jgi:hypothetical protein
MGFGLVIGCINHLHVVTTNNYYTITDLHNLQSLHTNLLSLFPPIFTIRFLATGTIKVSLNYTLPISLYYSTCQVFLAKSNSFYDFWPHHCSLGTSKLNCPKRISMSVINLRHGPRTENTAPILLHGADHTENTASSIVVCLNVFTEPFPGNASHYI